MRGVVAIVGRPNVGKSTLFNRWVRARASLVADSPGVTRDRIYGQVEGQDEDGLDGFIVVDTGGFSRESAGPVESRLIWAQTQAAMAEADVIVLLLDGREPVTEDDRQICDEIRRLDKPWVVAVNKIDGPEQRIGLWDHWSLGVEDIETLSAAHNRGVWELRDTVLERLREVRPKAQSPCIGRRVAILGRPNVGKSSILNRLVGRPRALVSDVPGTTRDSLDTHLRYMGEDYVLVDTAGVRRKARIYEAIEAQSVGQSLRSLDRADIAVLVIDASAGLTDQDARLADMALSQSKPLLLVVNKWDLVPDKHSLSQRDFAADIRARIRAWDYVPVLFTSALRNQRVQQILEHVRRLASQTSHRAGTAEVNTALRRIVNEHSPALITPLNRRVKFYYGTQVSVAPPKIVVFCNIAEEIQESYKRYMENRFRDLLGFREIPLRLVFRDRKPRELQGEQHADL